MTGRPDSAPLPVTRHPGYPRPDHAAAPHVLPPPAPGGCGVAAPAHTDPTGPDPTTRVLAARMVDADTTPVWQHYGQACVHCGRVFDPDERPDIHAPAIPGLRPAQRRCATDCRTDHPAHRPSPKSPTLDTIAEGSE